MNINENLEIFNMLKEAEVIKRENFDLNNKLDSYLNEINVLKQSINELLGNVNAKDQAIAKASRVIELLKLDVERLNTDFLTAEKNIEKLAKDKRQIEKENLELKKEIQKQEIIKKSDHRSKIQNQKLKDELNQTAYIYENKEEILAKRNQELDQENKRLELTLNQYIKKVDEQREQFKKKDSLYTDNLEKIQYLENNMFEIKRNLEVVQRQKRMQEEAHTEQLNLIKREAENKIKVLQNVINSLKTTTSFKENSPLSITKTLDRAQSTLLLDTAQKDGSISGGLNDSIMLKQMQVPIRRMGKIDYQRRSDNNLKQHLTLNNKKPSRSVNKGKSYGSISGFLENSINYDSDDKENKKHEKKNNSMFVEYLKVIVNEMIHREKATAQTLNLIIKSGALDVSIKSQKLIENYSIALRPEIEQYLMKIQELEQYIHDQHLLNIKLTTMMKDYQQILEINRIQREQEKQLFYSCNNDIELLFNNYQQSQTLCEQLFHTQIYTKDQITTQGISQRISEIVALYNQKIEKLQDQIIQLELNTNSLQQQNLDLTNKLKAISLAETNQQQINQNQNYQLQEQLNNQLVNQLKNLELKYQSDITNMQKQIDESKYMINSLNSEKNQFQTKNDELIKQIDLVNLEMTEQYKKIRNLKQFQEQAETQQNEKLLIQKKFDKVWTDYQATIELLEKTLKDLEKTQIVNQQINSKIDNLQTQNDKLLQENQVFQQKILEIEKQNQEYLDLIETRNSEIQLLETQINDLNSTGEMLRREISRLKDSTQNDRRIKSLQSDKKHINALHDTYIYTNNNKSSEELNVHESSFKEVHEMIELIEKLKTKNQLQKSGFQKRVREFEYVLRFLEKKIDDIHSGNIGMQPHNHKEIDDILSRNINLQDYIKQLLNKLDSIGKQCWGGYFKLLKDICQPLQQCDIIEPKDKEYLNNINSQLDIQEDTQYLVQLYKQDIIRILSKLVQNDTLKSSTYISKNKFIQLQQSPQISNTHYSESLLNTSRILNDITETMLQNVGHIEDILALIKNLTNSNTINSNNSTTLLKFNEVMKYINNQSYMYVQILSDISNNIKDTVTQHHENNSNFSSRLNKCVEKLINNQNQNSNCFKELKDYLAHMEKVVLCQDNSILHNNNTINQDNQYTIQDILSDLNDVIAITLNYLPQSDNELLSDDINLSLEHNTKLLKRNISMLYQEFVNMSHSSIGIKSPLLPKQIFNIAASIVIMEKTSSETSLLKNAINSLYADPNFQDLKTFKQQVLEKNVLLRNISENYLSNLINIGGVLEPNYNELWSNTHEGPQVLQNKINLMINQQDNSQQLNNSIKQEIYDLFQENIGFRIAFNLLNYIALKINIYLN